MSIKKIFFGLFIFSIAACEKPVTTVEGPKADPKLAVTCFISPQDSVIKVFVNKSLPVFGVKQNQQPPAVTNATVVLSEGALSVQLAYSPSPFGDDDDYYFISAAAFPIMGGRTYHLKVTTPDGLEATSECTVPDLGNNSLSYKLDSAISVNNYGDSMLEYTLEMKWTDKAGQADYYRAYAEFMMVYDNGMGGGDTSYNSFYMRTTNSSSDDQELTNDIDQDGKEFIARGSNFVLNNSSFIPRPKKLLIFLYHTDRGYHLYHESIFRGGNGGNPFSEPALIYTNMNKGLGVFAAFNSEYREITL